MSHALSHCTAGSRVLFKRGGQGGEPACSSRSRPRTPVATTQRQRLLPIRHNAPSKVTCREQS
eukprot:3265050-Rhodomonas_salina.1